MDNSRDAKALNTLSLARKAGLAELGEEPTGSAARSGSAALILVAGDASDHTWRRANSYASGKEICRVRVPFTKALLGQAVGRESLAIAAITDPALALAFLQVLPDPERYSGEAGILGSRVQRRRRRQAERKARRSSVRRGRAHPGHEKKQD